MQSLLYDQRASRHSEIDTGNAQWIGQLAAIARDLPWLPAPIVRTGVNGVPERVMVRWGMPSSKKALLDATTKRANKLRAKGGPVDFNHLLRMEPDKGTTSAEASLLQRPLPNGVLLVTIHSETSQ